ncbi:MAG: glycoside hydrolase family 38 C-terminal domain-containing protein, partial [Phycisphaerae bacterium]
RDKLTRSWRRVLANHMHDILPGTCLPRAYTYAWNDEITALNGFAAVLTDSVGAVARALDTNASGVPLVVYNPLAVEREDVVEAALRFDSTAPPSVRVFGPDGNETPSQVLERTEREIRLLFLARTPSLSWSVFDVRASDEPYTGDARLHVSDHELENEHYRVRIDANGDVASIVDKNAGDRELLARPARLVFTHERPQQWPAWNMDWADRQKPPIDALGGPPRVRVVERGPVRVALEIERSARDSVITQRIRLACGDAGRRVEFDTEIDWQSTECALRASFPLTVSNPDATYNLGLGTIARGNVEPARYEVPSHEWFDLTDRSGQYGVSILEDCKYGSDKPADDEVRLTLMYTPGVRHSYLDQHSQDWGRHNVLYALYGHGGDWRDGQSEWQARRLNQPLRVFQAPKHAGSLGRSFSLLCVNTPQVDVRAVKLSERSDEIIIRLQELWGRAAPNVELSVSTGINAAHETDGQERRIGAATLRDGKLVVNMTPYSPRTFAVKLSAPLMKLDAPASHPLTLDYDVDAVSTDADPADGAMDTAGRTLPAEMLPPELFSEGAAFRLGPTADGQPNALACRGQTIDLPAGDFNRVYLLAAATEDVSAAFVVGDQPQQRSIQRWTGFIGQWDRRVWDRAFDEVDHRCDGRVVSIATGYIRRDPVAWFCTHRHHPTEGNEAYRFSYLFKYGFDVPPDARTMRLPNEPRIMIFAATAARNDNDAVWPAAPLYDEFTNRKPIRFRHVYPAPPTPVFKGMTPVGAVQVDRAETFEALAMGPPVVDDYADQASGRGVTFRYYEQDGEFRPHAASGAIGSALPRLNDGVVARNDDDTSRCVWYDNAGRFYIDLGGAVSIARINSFSRHRGNRAAQFFSVWGSSAAAMPPAGFRHGKHGDWTLLAVVNTKELGDGGVHGSSITPPPDRAALGPYRHLLWVVQDVGQGTFFTEIDIHARQ